MFRRASNSLWGAVKIASSVSGYRNDLQRGPGGPLSRGLKALNTSNRSQDDESSVQGAQVDDARGHEHPSASSTTSGKDMLAVFTCTKCDTRSAKPFSKRAYNHGVVIVICPGCKSRHLLADRLGWFGESCSIEDILAERGEGVIRRSRDDGTVGVTLEEVLGQSGKK